MTWAEIERMLRKTPNCKFIGFSGGHSWWVNTETGARIKVSCHSSQEVPKNIEVRIKKLAGLK